jgi:hypothetical protein
MKKLPGLDFETHNPKFNVKRPEGKTDEEILDEVERKVIQMIDNYTHKEWECAQKILKHNGHVKSCLGRDESSVPFAAKTCRPEQEDATSQ